MAGRPTDYYPLQNAVPVGTTMGVGPPQATVVHVRAQPVGVGRKWDLTCCHCCGSCDGMGWGICCLTTFCFPCTFGFLKFRAFGNVKKALAWALLFTFMAVLVDVYIQVFFEPEEDNDESSDAEKQDPFVANNADVDEDDSRKFTFHQDKVKDKFEEHATAIVALYWVFAVVSFLTITIAGAWNRMQLRKKFEIDGPAVCCHGAPELEDACLWTFCKPCVLCQEVRTMVTNRVENGVWQGAVGTVVATNAATGIPASGVVMVPLSHATVPPAQNFDDSRMKV